MSEDFEHVELGELPQPDTTSVDDVLAAIQQKNIAVAKASFGDLMAQKVNDALENEKVAIANQIFNNAPEELESEEEEVEYEEEVESDEDIDIESELEDIFDEEESEV